MDVKEKEYDPKATFDWRTMPLFSPVLDPKNPQAQAIIAMQNEEKPKIRAKVYKESGNRALALNRLPDAIKYYDQAIGVLSLRSKKNLKLKCIVFANRALAELKLKNYSNCIRDCKKAISCNPNYFKTYFRYSLALKSLEKYSRAEKIAQKGIEIVSQLIINHNSNSNESLLPSSDSESDNSSNSESHELEEESKVRLKIFNPGKHSKKGRNINLNRNRNVSGMKSKTMVKSELEILEEAEKRFIDVRNKYRSMFDKCEQFRISKKKTETIAQLKEQTMKQELDAILQSRNISINEEIDIYNIGHTYGTDYQIKRNKRNLLSFPVLFIYPEFNESDFIQAFMEDVTFLENLRNIFPPIGHRPKWDKFGIYSIDNLCVYYETFVVDKKLKKVKMMVDRMVNVNMDKTLMNIVQKLDFVLYQNIPVFYILPKKGSNYRQTFLSEKASKMSKIYSQA